MKMKLGGIVLSLMMVSFFSPLAFGQDQNQSGQKGKSDVRTMTGCLSKGDSAHEYQLTADDGSTWEIRSSKVMLSEHVGHEVTLTGVVKNVMAHNMKEDTKDAAADAGMKKDNTEHGHMTVTRLKMVSDSCQK